MTTMYTVGKLFGLFSVATTLVIVLSLAAASATAGLAIMLGRGLDLLLSGGSLPGHWYWPVAAETLVIVLSTVLTPVVIARDKDISTREQRENLLQHYLAIGPLRLRRLGEGELVSIAMDSVERAARYRTEFIGPALSAVATPLLVLGFIAVFIDPLSALLLLILTPLVPLIVIGFQRRFRASSGEYRRSQGILAATFLEALRSLDMLKLNGASQWMGQRIARASERVRQQVMKLLSRNQLVLLVIDSSFAVLLLSSAALLAWWRASTGAISPGSAVALIALSFLTLAPVNYVGSFFYVGMTGRAAEEKITQVLREPIHRASLHPARASLGDHALQLQEVSAHYAQDEDALPALSGVTLNFPAGSRTAIIGPSGSGKTTLLRVLQGQLEISSGTIHDGHRTLGPATLRANTAVLDQGAELFGSSVRHNLGLGRPQASDEEMIEVLSAVGMGPWLAAQPQKLDTKLGEAGARLSGGQAQRMALARALLARRSVLLLDEPTSALDVRTEAEVLDTIRRVTAGLTTVTVTHRLGLLQDYDYVVVLENGHVIQAGRREELLATPGHLKSAMGAYRRRTNELYRALGTQGGEQ
ncbi:ABC transporter ATP-binding protein [Glutamicibacter sp. PS]|uniref:ABC transporter ATP-binding protein n=1 Tax=Glutamicibacter sp. PS TaxID=3075634 RepID=UPI00283E0442|nr:ABC transporter ATP-binding protein [Glutamicibacter sp. PS]MDR4534069.1 ABC transporter ATP-binding protein/permease [Glutamicibacter sp. PS]